MSGDILHNKAARPSTVFPGHWLINLPPDTPIHIQRYRSTEAVSDSREQGLLEDTLEVQWRKIDSTGDGGLKDILAGGCATIVHGAEPEHERELWIFSTDGAKLEDLQSLEHILPDPHPITPAELLECSRHGPNISCLSQPSTSQRPTISCDVHFEPRGEERIAWERLGLAIWEKAEWKRGKRVAATATDIQLLPDLNGLMLKIKPRKRSATRPPKTATRIQIIQPLGIPALPIGPYRPTDHEASTLAPSFETALGSAWKDGQSAFHLEAQLVGRIYWDYTTVWIPKSTSIASRPSFDNVTEWKKGSGILAIWPTHLMVDAHDSDRKAARIRTVRDMPILESSVDLLGTASGVFDAISTYREPIDQLTPPGDNSLDTDNLVELDPTEPSPSYNWSDTQIGNGHDDSHDDLEDLFASPTSHDSANHHFELFGEDDDRRNSLPMDNSHLIDYDDVVMTSPPPHERRESLREVMGDVEEAGPGLITDDDFNFFDSPPDPDAVVSEPPAAILMPTPESLTHTVPAQDLPTPDHPTVLEVTPPEPSPVVELPPLETKAPSPEPPTIASPVSPKLPLDRQSPKRRRTRAEELIPLEFAPLDLAHSHNDALYHIPIRSVLPTKLNLDLVERLKGPYKKGKKIDYSLAWRLDASDTESDIEEYTRPPTPISEYDDTVSTHPGPSPPPSGPQDEVDGQSKYHYQGQWCIAAGLPIMLSRVNRPDHVYVPWQASWGEDSPTDLLEPPATIPKKRKSIGIEDSSTLRAFAKQIIQNRLARQISRPSCEQESCVDSGLADEGVVLSDLATVDDTPLDLPPCSIHTGFHGNVIQLSGASLRYWSELGLQPLSGPKNLKVVFITRHVEDEAQARRLVETLRNVYSSLNLGTLEIDSTHGRAGHQIISGQEPLFDVNQIHDDSRVMLTFLRNEQMSFGACIKDLPETKRNQTIHILPLSLDSRDIPDAAREIYNSISHQIRPVHPTQDPVPWHNYPAFTLAPTERPKPKLTMGLDFPIQSFDVFGSWRWIHAAYTFDEESDTLAMFIVDAEGDDWDVKVETGLGAHWRNRVQAMWDWIVAFGDSAAIEWRVAICSLGIMGQDEMKAWRSVFIARAPPITVMMCDPSPSTGHITKPKAGPANVPQGMLTDPSTTIFDEFQTGAYLPLSQRQSIQSGTSVIYSDSSFLLSIASPNLEYSTSTYHVMWHRPSPGSYEADVDQELAGEMYRLACWGAMRFGLEGLPAPLAAVGAVRDALSTGSEDL